MSTTLACSDKGFRKSESVAKTLFLWNSAFAYNQNINYLKIRSIKNIVCFNSFFLNILNYPITQFCVWTLLCIKSSPMIEDQSKYFHAWPMIDDCYKDFMNAYLKQQQSFI